MSSKYKLHVLNASELNPAQMKWLQTKAFEPEIQAIEKPLRDGLVRSIYILEQFKISGPAIVAVTATRQLGHTDPTLIQLPLYERRNASYEECRRLRIIQTSSTLRETTKLEIESLSARSSIADEKAHASLAFDKLGELSVSRLDEYVQVTDGHAFQPWLRPTSRSIPLAARDDWRDRLVKLGEQLHRILAGEGVEIKKTYRIIRPKKEDQAKAE